MFKNDFQLLIKLVALSYLNSVLWQVRLEGEHFPGVDVGVVGILESLLQLVQLVRSRERLNLTSIFLFRILKCLCLF